MTDESERVASAGRRVDCRLFRASSARRVIEYHPRCKIAPGSSRKKEAAAVSVSCVIRGKASLSRSPKSSNQILNFV